LNQQLDGKRIRKLRYFYDYEGRVAEFDVFQDDLANLVVVDFEFATLEEKESFQMPGFCLRDVTQEVFLAGGMICGKTYEDIKDILDKFEYNELFL